LKDGSLDNLDDLPAPDMLAQEIVEHLEAALASFRAVSAALPRSAETRWRALQGASKIPFSVGAHPVRDALRSRRARASRTGCAPTR